MGDSNRTVLEAFLAVLVHMRVSEREDTPLNGCQVLRLFGTKCIIPKGMKVVEMWPTTPYILGSMTPAYTWRNKTRVNPDLFAFMNVKLLIEECIHGFQYRRMDRGWGFFPTYIWQLLIDVVNKRHRNGKSIHNANLMEREAMEGALKIAEGFDYTNKYMDIEAEIKKHFGW